MGGCFNYFSQYYSIYEYMSRIALARVIRKWIEIITENCGTFVIGICFILQRADLETPGVKGSNPAKDVLFFNENYDNSCKIRQIGRS